MLIKAVIPLHCYNKNDHFHWFYRLSARVSKNVINYSSGPKANDTHVINQWFSTKNEFLPREHLATPAWAVGVGVLLASNRQRSEMLLNILQCTAQPPQQRTFWPPVSTVSRLKNSALDWPWNSDARFVASFVLPSAHRASL